MRNDVVRKPRKFSYVIVTDAHIYQACSHLVPFYLCTYLEVTYLYPLYSRRYIHMYVGLCSDLYFPEYSRCIPFPCLYAPYNF